MLRVIRYATLFLSAAGALAAQQQQSMAAKGAKATLTNADYAKWETLGAGALSPDGKWVAYDFRRGNGSTELRYRARRCGERNDRPLRDHSAVHEQQSLAALHDSCPTPPAVVDAAVVAARGGRGGAGAAAPLRRRTATRSASSTCAPERRIDASTTFSRTR